MEKIYLNSNTHRIIKNDISENMLNHSYLIISNDKFKINAFTDYVCCSILANDDFSGTIAKKILHGNHADVKQFPATSKSIVTEDINKIVSDSYVLPMEAQKKIYVLKNFEQATVQAQNKLLKTLEEPPKSVVFVITTSNENGVLPTIRSRCKKIVEGRISDEEVLRYVSGLGKLSAEEAKMIAELSQGNLTFADSYVNDRKYLEMVNLSKDIFNNLLTSANVLNYSAKMLKYKTTFEDFFNVMLLTLRNIFVDKTTKNVQPNIKYSSRALTKIVDVLNTAIEKVRCNCNPVSVCDGVLMGILEVRFKCQK